MIKISKLTDYAFVLLSTLAASGQSNSVSQLSNASDLPEPTTAKVMKMLSAGGIVEAERGAKGGYRLVKATDDISVQSVIVAMEGPIALTTCVDEGAKTCDYSAGCPISGRWGVVNSAIKDALAGISLAQLINAKPVLKIQHNEETQIEAVK